jgi:4-amino-4-deoxy-L-arabinose transferase-like glycosyltransferase
MKFLIKKSFKKPIYILILVCLTLFFYKIGSYKLIDVDEPRYAEAAREMLVSHNWITPYFNYVIRLDKPVFFYWLIAIAYKIFGVNEFAARFPSALLASSSVMFLYYFASKTISKNVGFLSALILASSIQFIALARLSITDMSLSFFIVATIMSGYLGSVGDDKKRKYWWWLAYFLSALAVLTKGPVGFVLPAAIMGLYFLLVGQLKENLKLKYILPGILIFLATIVPWYYLVIKIHGKYFIEYFLLKNNLQRFSGANFTEHSQPFYFYIYVILIGFIPWSLSFVPAITKYMKELSGNFKTGIKNAFLSDKIALFKNADARTKILLYAAVWFFTVLVFFSISSAKLITYVLPLFPAMAIFAGIFWDEYIYENKNNKSTTIPFLIFNSILLLVGIIFLLGSEMIFKKTSLILPFVDMNICNIYAAITFVIVPIISIICIKKSYKKLLFISLLTLMSCLIMTAVNVVLPIVYNNGQVDLIDYIEFSKSKNIPIKNLIVFGMEKPSMVFYSGEKVTFTGDDFDNIKFYMNKKEPYLMIIRNRYMQNIPTNIKYYVINKGVRYSLLSNKEIKKRKGLN